MDIRLQQEPFEINGKTYMLRCNFNVLADVQEAFDGDFLAALDSSHSYRGVLEFITAMLNDYADEQGWPERYTAKKVGRLIPMNSKEAWQMKIAKLIVSAVSGEGETSETEENPNAPTT